MNGPQSQYPAFLINIHRVESKSDAEAYVSRLNGLGPAIDELVADSRERAAKGWRRRNGSMPSDLGFEKRHLRRTLFQQRGDAPLYADLKAKVGKLAIAQAEKDARFVPAPCAYRVGQARL